MKEGIISMKFILQKVALALMQIILLYCSLILLLSITAGSLIYKSTESLILAAVLIWIGHFLVKSKKQAAFVSFTLIGLMYSLLFISYNTNEITSNMSAARYLTHSCSIASLIIALSLIMKNKYINNLITIILISLVLSIVALFWGFYLMTGGWFSPDIMLAILQTNFNEATEYLCDYFNLKTMLLLIVIVYVGYLLYSNIKKIKATDVLQNSKLLATFSVVAILFVTYKSSNNIVSEVFYNANHNLDVYNDFREKQIERKQSLSLYNDITSNAPKGIYVLVIGESESRDYMSAYGYNKPTTPWLDKMSRQDNFILLKDAYSCHVHTVQVLTYALTAKNQYNSVDVRNAPSIIEIAEAAGYETAWLSNQVRYGAWDTPITVIASEANQQDWINHNSGESSSTNYYDSKLLESVEKLKMQDNMFIVIHLMGSHNSYDQRYPKDFAKFTTSGDIGKYENSIVYTDYVLSKLYDRFKAMPNFQCMVYFSDHADDVAEDLGHNAARFTFDMTHIPVFACFSEKYTNDKADIVKRLRSSNDKTFTNDLMYNMILGIMGVQVKGLYEAGNDITSDKYWSEESRFRTMYGDRKIH